MGRSVLIEIDPGSLGMGLMIPCAQAIGIEPWARKVSMEANIGSRKADPSCINISAGMLSIPGDVPGLIVSRAVCTNSTNRGRGSRGAQFFSDRGGGGG